MTATDPLHHATPTDSPHSAWRAGYRHGWNDAVNGIPWRKEEANPYPELPKVETPKLDPLPYKHPDLPDDDEVAGLRYSYPIKFTSGVSKFLPRPLFSQNRADYGLDPAHD